MKSLLGGQQRPDSRGPVLWRGAASRRRPEPGVTSVRDGATDHDADVVIRIVRDAWQLFLDVLVAAVVGLEGFRILQAGTPDVAALALLILSGLAAGILRRVAPGGALVVAATVAILLSWQSGQHLAGWSLLEICLASFAIRRPRAQAVLATTLVGLLLVSQSMLWLNFSVYDPTVLALVWWTAAAGGVGSAVRYQRRYMLVHREQSLSLAKTREADVARLIAEERMRIARELHDVLAHHIAAISVHASSAEANTRTNPDSAVDSLVLIRTASGEVLNELQAILHVLRSGQPATEAEGPVAGSTQIPRLLESFRSLGLEIDFNQGSHFPGNMSPALDLAIYRIIQEALTNVQKHGTGTARIDVTASPGSLRLTIRNKSAATSGTRCDSPPNGRHGFGLLGMRERAESAGGTLRVSSENGWFTVGAEFPIETLR